MVTTQYIVSAEIVQGVLSGEGDQMRRVLQSRLIMVVLRCSCSKWNLELMEKKVNRVPDLQSCKHMWIHCLGERTANSPSPRHCPYVFGSSSDN